MDAVAALERLGGVGTITQVTALCTRASLRAAVRDGRVTRLARGRLVLATAERDQRRAIELAGVRSHLSAAVEHGWAVKSVPDRPWVTVRRKRRLEAETRATIHVAYADLADGEADNGVTTPLRTVLDCARRLPFDGSRPTRRVASRWCRSERSRPGDAPGTLTWSTPGGAW